MQSPATGMNLVAVHELRGTGEDPNSALLFYNNFLNRKH